MVYVFKVRKIFLFRSIIIVVILFTMKSIRYFYKNKKEQIVNV